MADSLLAAEKQRISSEKGKGPYKVTGNAFFRSLASEGDSDVDR